MADSDTKVVAAFGDSITDGYLLTIDGYAEWPSVLAERLVESEIAVINMAIGGSKVINDLFLGQNALARFERDILAQPGVTHVILYLEVNDIIHPDHFDYPEIIVTADQIIAGYKQIAMRAHANDIIIFGATVTPFGEWGSAAAEERRQKINEWIRNNDYFDGFIDFDSVLRDPDEPTIIKAEYDNDGLHPNDAGEEAMGQLVDLSIFTD